MSSQAPAVPAGAREIRRLLRGASGSGGVQGLGGAERGEGSGACGGWERSGDAVVQGIPVMTHNKFWNHLKPVWKPAAVKGACVPSPEVAGERSLLISLLLFPSAAPVEGTAQWFSQRRTPASLRTRLPSPAASQKRGFSGLGVSAAPEGCAGVGCAGVGCG